MIKPIGKVRIVYLLFISAFMLYAISPLSFNASNLFAGNIGLPAASKQNPHVFLLDLLISGLSESGQDSEKGHDFKILLKKTRAIVSKNTVVKASSASAVSAAGTAIALVALFFTFIEAVRQKVPAGFSIFYSGHSPPI